MNIEFWMEGAPWILAVEKLKIVYRYNFLSNGEKNCNDKRFLSVGMKNSAL